MAVLAPKANVGLFEPARSGACRSRVHARARCDDGAVSRDIDAVHRDRVPVDSPNLLARDKVPGPDAAIPPTGDGVPGVSADFERRHWTEVTPERRQEFLPANLPQLDPSVLATRDDVGAILTDRHGENVSGLPVAPQGRLRDARWEHPHSDRLVGAARCSELAVRRNGYRMHTTEMRRDCATARAACRVPESKGAVAATRDKQVALVRQGNAGDFTPMTLKDAE